MFIHDDARDAPNYGGCVPVDTTPALYLCTGPSKIPINPTPPRRAARTTRSQRFSTTAPGIQLDLYNRDMSHRVQQLENAHGPTNGLDHRKQPLRRDGEMNLHDLHNRDVDHRVQELQPCNHHGLLNSKTMGISFCGTKGMSTANDELQLRNDHWKPRTCLCTTRMSKRRR